MHQITPTKHEWRTQRAFLRSCRQQQFQNILWQDPCQMQFPLGNISNGHPHKRAFFHWKGNLLKKLWVDPDGKALTFIASFFHHENFFFAGLQMKFPRTGLQVLPSPMVISESNHACNHSYNLQINDLSNAMIYTLGQNFCTRGQKLRFAPVWWLYGLMNGFGFPIYQEIEFLARFLLNFLLSGNVTVSDVWFSYFVAQPN